jgi:hypothetical protein
MNIVLESFLKQRMNIKKITCRRPNLWRIDIRGIGVSCNNDRDQTRVISFAHGMRL